MNSVNKYKTCISGVSEVFQGRSCQLSSSNNPLITELEIHIKTSFELRRKTQWGIYEFFLLEFTQVEDFLEHLGGALYKAINQYHIDRKVSRKNRARQRFIVMDRLAQHTASWVRIGISHQTETCTGGAP